MVKQWNKVQPLCLQCRRFNLWLNLFLLALSTSRSAAICSSISLIDTVYILLVISVFTELQWLHICLRLQEIGVSKTLLLELSVYQCYEDETISLKWPFFFFFVVQYVFFPKVQDSRLAFNLWSTVMSRAIFHITAVYPAPCSYVSFLLLILIPSKVYYLFLVLFQWHPAFKTFF